jgi:hypothetical protein
MKSFWIKIVLIFVLLSPISLGCKDDCVVDDSAFVEPYWQMRGLDFINVQSYRIHKGRYVWDIASKDYVTTEFQAENMVLYFMTPDGDLWFHSEDEGVAKKRLGLMQEAYACNRKQAGYKGTFDKVHSITIASKNDFDETHSAYMNMSDIVDIFAYTTSGAFKEPIPLDEFNRTGPHEATKRFFLIIRRPARIDSKQQFVITYHMHTEPGEASRVYEVETPVFNVVVATR